MYLIYSRLYPQGQATTRLHYVSCNRALDQPWKQNHRHRKGPRSQPDGEFSFVVWMEHSKHEDFKLYILCDSLCFLTTSDNIDFFQRTDTIYKGICEQTKEIRLSQLKDQPKNIISFLVRFVQAMKFNEHQAILLFQMKEKFP